MPRVLGIDLSMTSTGLCRADLYDDTEPIIDSITLATVTSKPTTDKTYTAVAQRLNAITEAIEAGLDGVSLAVLEGPAFSSKGQGVHSRYWLWGKVYDVVAGAGIPVLVPTPNQRAMYATGKGNSPKDAVLAAVIRRWPTVQVAGNDQADALILAAIGARHLGLPMDDVPSSFHGRVMPKLSA